MDREKYQKSEDILVDCLTSSLIGNWNMDQRAILNMCREGFLVIPKIVTPASITEESTLLLRK
jgi:hypothetical protein